MSNQCYVQIAFTNAKPNKKTLKRLNLIMGKLDYDFPGLTENGYSGYWRKPFMFKEMMNLIHRFGFPVKYKIIDNAYNRYFEYSDKCEKEYIKHCLSEEEWIKENLDIAKARTSINKSVDKNHLFYDKIRKLSRKF